MLQPDTFEAVKINVFSMLVELAQTFNEEQLDFLFKKFESSASRTNADNKQGMLLLFRLAKYDQQVISQLGSIAGSSSSPEPGRTAKAAFLSTLHDVLCKLCVRKAFICF